MELFTVGSAVRIRPWEEIVSIFGLDPEAEVIDIAGCMFPREEFQQLCGHIVWVEDIIEWQTPDGEDCIGYELSGTRIQCLPAMTVI